MVKFPDSLDKIFDYFSRLENNPVKLSPLFFRELICPGNCGACCRYKFTTDWFPDLEYQIPLIVNDKFIDIQERTVVYNRTNILVYSVYPHGHSCGFLDDVGRCMIHHIKPLTCRLEPIKFFPWRGSIVIQKRKYGRGHFFTRVDGITGAACEFAKYNSKSWSEDIHTLEYLVNVGALFHLRLTPIRRLIAYLIQNKSTILEGNISQMVML